MRMTALSIAAIAVSGLIACSRTPPSEPAAVPAATAGIAAGDPVEGARIAQRVGCAGCHMPDGRGGGMDVSVPTGDRIVAPNLTVRRAGYQEVGLVGAGAGDGDGVTWAGVEPELSRAISRSNHSSCSRTSARWWLSSASRDGFTGTDGRGRGCRLAK